jgi:hypothetical protein|tara:strand:+ start:579 stop:776 length:198 start_codon:yes stop_codon:yes gene_type:complete
MKKILILIHLFLSIGNYPLKNKLVRINRILPENWEAFTDRMGMGVGRAFWKYIKILLGKRRSQAV